MPCGNYSGFTHDVTTSPVGAQGCIENPLLCEMDIGGYQTELNCPSMLLCTYTYYKPMGDLPYISSEQEGGLIIRTKLIYELPYISVLYLYKNFELKRGWAYNTS